MNVLNSRSGLIEQVTLWKSEQRSIGFVPTMGALHEGHLSLVRKACEQCDEVVVSIFVNPTQFNNPSDLANYPRTLENDLMLLKQIGNITVFSPTVEDIYPIHDDFKPIDLNGLDGVLEGKFRPGHFEGVVHVVYNLFQLVQPDKAFFGLKDFQQVAVIKHMIQVYQLPIELVACSTSRSKEGLALSSRNMRLNPNQKIDALIIYNTLQEVIRLKTLHTPAETRAFAESFFQQGKLKLEYLEIVDSNTLTPLDSTWSESSTCCIAAFCGDVRLIDNIQC